MSYRPSIWQLQAEQARQQQAHLWLSQAEARVQAQEAQFAAVQAQQATAIQQHWNALNAQNREVNVVESAQQQQSESLRRQAEEREARSSMMEDFMCSEANALEEGDPELVINPVMRHEIELARRSGLKGCSSFRCPH